jgi:hypothetical protein
MQLKSKGLIFHLQMLVPMPLISQEDKTNKAIQPIFMSLGLTLQFKKNYNSIQGEFKALS